MQSAWRWRRSARRRLPTTTGLVFAKAMPFIGSGASAGFGGGLPALRRQVLLTAWREATDFERFLDQPLVHRPATEARNSWWSLFDVVSTRGTHYGSAPLSSCEMAVDGPLAALTLGRVQLLSLPRFLREGVPAGFVHPRRARDGQRRLRGLAAQRELHDQHLGVGKGHVALRIRRCRGTRRHRTARPANTGRAIAPACGSAVSVATGAAARCIPSGWRRWPQRCPSFPSLIGSSRAGSSAQPAQSASGSLCTRTPCRRHATQASQIAHVVFSPSGLDPSKHRAVGIRHRHHDPLSRRRTEIRLSRE